MIELCLLALITGGIWLISWPGELQLNNLTLMNVEDTLR